MESLEIIICSFLASLGLGVVFRIDRKNLLWAALGGALTRAVYLLLIEATSLTAVQSFFAAVCAALYAELMAMRKKTPSTVFLYPSILPLIPGDTLYYISFSLLSGDMTSTIFYLWKCILQLGGICMGFVIISTFTYYRRIYFLGERLEKYIVRALHHIIRSCIH